MSVVSPPRLTIADPGVCRISIPAPMASAIQRSTIRTSRALTEEWINRSKNAFFSISVTSVGTAITYSVPLVKKPSSVLSTHSRRYCISPILDITPSFIGNAMVISPGVFSNISYARSPTAKISVWFRIATAFFTVRIRSSLLS